MTYSIIRALIREQIIFETPLMDVIPFKNRAASKERKADLGDFHPYQKAKPAIGYKISRKFKGSEEKRRKDFADVAKVLLSNSYDNWYVIVLNDVGDTDSATSHAYEVVESDEFKKWISSLNIPKGSKIIVPSSSRVDRDYLSPEWQIAHDVIGHSIMKHLQLKLWYDLQSIDDCRLFHREVVWETLPDEFKISKHNKIDRLPDIFAAIFANKFDKQKAILAIENSKPKYARLYATGTCLFTKLSTKEIVDDLEKAVREFVSTIPFDKPTVIDAF